MKYLTQSYKIIFFASLGTIIEWAEYIFYGYIAVKLSKYFFPSGHETLNLIKTFGLFAAGYLMRPLGALIFGSIGDTLGRKNALMISMMLMGFATMGIGLLPHYEHIGFWAPLLLLFLRLVQGVAVSGEYNGAAIYVIEHAKHRPCFAGSFIPASAAFGMVVGGIASWLVSLESMPEWSYRIPFLIGGFGCWVALWMRRHLDEPAMFVKSKTKAQQQKISNLWTRYFPHAIRVGVIAALTGVYVYIGNVYFVVFLNKHCGFSLAQATLVGFSCQAMVALLIPLAGWLGDRLSPMAVYRKACLGAALAIPALYYLSASGSMTGLVIGMVIYAVINALMSGTMMVIVQHEFPTEFRYRGTALSWSIAVAIFGGTAPMMAQILQSTLQVSFACSFYVSFFALLAWWVLGVEWSTQRTRIKQDYKPKLVT